MINKGNNSLQTPLTFSESWSPIMALFEWKDSHIWSLKSAGIEVYFTSSRSSVQFRLVVDGIIPAVSKEASRATTEQVVLNTVIFISSRSSATLKSENMRNQCVFIDVELDFIGYNRISFDLLAKKKYGPRYRDPFTSMKADKNITPTRPTHKAGKGISRRIESVASQKEVPGRMLKSAENGHSDIMHGAIRSVDFDEGVFGIAHSEIIAKEDMQQLFEHEELGIAVIHTYIWYMYDTLMRGTELCNRFNFIAASRINTTLITKNPTSVKNELVDRFMAAGDNTTPSLYFLPFNSGNGGH
ncbi:hypothetical protein KIW84_064192 [Lathyrus oleraceus]|uniref:Uncharacterized protein n=1 Tax=Pisum sativum TaxID=3888 RepID=A0A9D5A5U5_PEA|nr:hypothetical protein KIW84_064192 [Pisum sativum]